ncbi:Nucleotide-binding universal stress protein, UspA family [Saccharopolyspora kobensis]|uniref:Nucleotide-binding universal stress protein, UspA family n=1 Tax=Saccharopolyspora kobensis TaxID=146035 RepID=A0A1H5V7V8_9PSEU|nr:universal stress protein [Saccharopolyspora kobensis]SEF82851.1 Nucleotide-binding universal stress protein, UspA family [Saccharopolyspora kobensis]SFC64704.1 Nucleotide-binding universal stress protein, UspA family [Saccharopolyspora kobensis]
MASRQPLVVGVDGSDASARALRWALGEARRRGAPVHALAVWESRAVMAGPAPLLMNPDLAPHHVREQRWQELTRLVRDCMGSASSPEVHAELVEGDAAETLAERSVGAAMLVMGDHGRGRLADAVLGSTALRCIHRARCPVVVVPAGVESDPEPAGGQSIDPVLG